MAIGDEETSKEDTLGDDDTSKVLPSTDKLATEVDSLSEALISQDKLLKHATHERKEYKDKLEQALKDLLFTKSYVVVSNEVECNACAILMSNLPSMQTKYATLLDELEEVKAVGIS